MPAYTPLHALALCMPAYMLMQKMNLGIQKMKRKDIKRRPLSDTALSGLEPEATAYREKDGDGLYFRVKPNGTKSWELRYKKPDGKWSWHGLGGYPDLSGAMACEKARAAKRLVASGTDPVQHKAAQRVAKETAGADTFGAAAEYWYQRKAQDGRAASTLRLMRGYLDNDVLPALGSKLLIDITRRDCANLQESIEARGALNTRDKIRVALRQIFSQAIARGLCEHNPASELGAIAAPTPKAKQDFVEAQLAHKEQGMAGVYNQAAYLEQRRSMLQWYADYRKDWRIGTVGDCSEGTRDFFKSCKS